MLPRNGIATRVSEKEYAEEQIALTGEMRMVRGARRWYRAKRLYLLAKLGSSEVDVA